MHFPLRFRCLTDKIPPPPTHPVVSRQRPLAGILIFAPPAFICASGEKLS